MRILGCLFMLLCVTCAHPPESAPRAPLTIETYTASEVSARVNAHLIVGESEAMLVDATMTLDDAESVLEMVERSGRRLRTIFITNSQPDKYLGLAVLTERFPEARVLATSQVVSDIRARGPGYLRRLRARWGERIASSLIVPEPIRGNALEIDGLTVEIHRFTGGACPNQAALYLPAIRTLLPGAIVVEGSHLFLRERDIRSWRGHLEWIRMHGGIDRIHPGYGAASDLSVLDDMLRYLLDFEAAVALGEPEAAVAAMLDRYPDYALERLLREYSVPAYLPGT